LLVPAFIVLLMAASVVSAQPYEIPQEELEPAEPAGPAGVDWMSIWVNYWWLIVIALGLAAGLMLSFAFTRGLP